MSRISVIGAGIGGMCTAARLASSGHHVELFESSDRVGGKCRTEWIGDYCFDLGPTLLTLPAVFRDFFIKTGAPMESVLTLESVDPSFDYQFTDGSKVQFSNLSRYETLLSIERTLGTQSAKDWSKLMLRASDIWDISRTRFIESALPSPLSLLKSPTLVNDLRTITPWKSLRSLVSSYSSDRRLQYIVDRYATYSGSDPRSAPAALLSIAFVEETFGAWHISGGIGRLSQAIFERACDRGVIFHLNTQVKKIENDGNRVSALELADGTKIASDLIVSNADASILYNSLLDGEGKILKSPRKYLSKAAPSVAGFSIHFGLKKELEESRLFHHTVLFPENYDQEFNSIFRDAHPVLDPAIYICSPNDPKMVRHEKQRTLSVLVNAPRHSLDGNGWDWSDKSYAREYAEKIINRIEARGLPIRTHMELMEIRTPADLERDVLAPGGSIYGTSSNGARAAFRRTKNRSPLRGLFCVGGSAHPGGGLPLVAISAEIVSNMIGKA